MAQRHKSLIPLSHDHYEGLLLSQQIRADRIMMKDWPADPVGRARFVAGFHEEHLKTHFIAEEESLFPLIRKHVPQAATLVEQLIGEHRRMEQFAAQFSGADAPTISRELSEFSSLLEQHIRKEERELFPLFEMHASKEVLEQAEQMIQQHYPSKKR
jgi:hemerythrin-like domain-containing protein